MDGLSEMEQDGDATYCIAINKIFWSNLYPPVKGGTSYRWVWIACLVKYHIINSAIVLLSPYSYYFQMFSY